MSDNPFGLAADEAPEVIADDADGGSSRRLLALGALAAAVVGAGAFLLLGGGGSDDLELASPPAGAVRAAAAGDAAPSAAPVLPAASRVTLGRNPFRALYVQPAAPAADPAAPAAAAGAPDAGAGVAAPGGVTIRVDAPAAAPGSAASSGVAPSRGGGAGAKAPAPKEHKLVLMRVFGEGKDQSAVFSIDGKQQTAKVGSTFGPTAEILLLSLQQGPEDAQWTAVLQVGDSDPFDVVTGEPAYVR